MRLLSMRERMQRPLTKEQEKIFNEIIVPYSKNALNILQGQIDTHEDREEIIFTALLQTAQYMANKEEEIKHYKGFFSKVLSRRVIDFYRKKKLDTVSLDYNPDPNGKSSYLIKNRVATHQDAKRLRNVPGLSDKFWAKAQQVLSSRQFTIVEMKDRREMDNETIRELTGLSSAAIWTAYHRAKKNLSDNQHLFTEFLPENW